MLPTQDTLALEQLGWSSFQDLAIAVCEDLLGLPIATFSPTKDLGIDGVIEPIPGRRSHKNLVVQAKHTSTFANLSLAGFRPEAAKVASLATEISDLHYVLVTNLRVSVAVRNSIKSQLRQLGVQKVAIVGRENLVRRVRKSPSLRSMVPRLYGIGDLSQILDDRRLGQAMAMLQSVTNDLDKFVVTDSYKRSLNALKKNRMLFLLGDPAVGKSTIARCLSVAAIDEFQSQPIILESMDRLADHWNVNDPKRVFWIDDAFGATQKDEQQVASFNRLIPLITTAMRHGARFIFTSRTYIWQLTKPSLKLNQLPDYESARVEIDVRRFSDFERGQIVYNHIKGGDQDANWVASFKAFLPAVARHPEFKPEVARRLGLKSFTANLQPTETAVSAFVANPGTFLEETIGGLDAGSRAALAALLMSGGALQSPVTESEPIQAAAALFGVSAGEIRTRLEALEGSFLKRERDEDGEMYWRFWHPTIGEALASVARRQHEMLDVYLEGASLSRMLREVTCVGKPVTGAILEVSPSRFPKLITRLSASKPGDIGTITFLAYRATPEFRRMYFRSPPTSKHPVFGNWAVSNTFYMTLVHELWKDDFLSDELLESFSSRITDEIINGIDVDVLSDEVRDIIGNDRFETALERAWAQFRDNPGYILGSIEEDLEDDIDPEDALYPAQAYLEALIAILPDDPARDDILAEFEGAVCEKAAEIKANREEQEREREHEHFGDYEGYAPTVVSAPARPTPTRDPLTALFSDVDVRCKDG